MLFLQEFAKPTPSRHLNSEMSIADTRTIPFKPKTAGSLAPTLISRQHDGALDIRDLRFAYCSRCRGLTLGLAVGEHH
jgi:hypothetical protein